MELTVSGKKQKVEEMQNGRYSWFKDAKKTIGDGCRRSSPVVDAIQLRRQENCGRLSILMNSFTLYRIQKQLLNYLIECNKVST